MRKLVTVRKITNIKPITGADNIDVALVDGWEVVVKKNEFNPGDYVVYFEIDSFLPIIPEFEFLRNTSYKKMADGSEGFRIRTRTIRGQISQGLVMPFSFLQDRTNLILREYSDEELRNTDFSEILNVTKYEPPIPAELNGEVIGAYPSFITKTDEERVQNLSDYYEEYKQYTYYVSEKTDGTSSTFYINNGIFGVCQRNWELAYSETNTFWKIAKQYDIENKLRSLNRNLAIQGELIGEGIQSNRYKLLGQKLKVFNVFDIDRHRYLSKYEMELLCVNLDLEMVPIIHVLYNLPENMSDLILTADGMSKINSSTLREGMVLVANNSEKRISFKAISNKYLGKYE